ncbi:hypothetical protein [Micromonospora sp. NBRC 101691]|uniref:hypothetical protein n=1 Tax=Micromonospora sp. NBRC 101691 TaxID=3032198 RepID=UPI0024A1F850|nr:hypothetical protein [Micromonospora sp. NBRC 101691]GLY21294.1 hypothetical protein Misp04_10260 [Micromonospora sp. NBRC 101691]
MTAEPLPSRSADDDDSGDLLPHLEPTADLVRPTLPEMLRALHDLSKASPDFQAEVVQALSGGTPEPGRRLRLVGRARKVSVSMPEDLTAAVQQRVGRGEFSQYVTEAVARQLELDLLGELAALLESEYGPVSDELLTEARNSWPDAQ